MLLTKALEAQLQMTAGGVRNQAAVILSEEVPHSRATVRSIRCTFPHFWAFA